MRQSTDPLMLYRKLFLIRAAEQAICQRYFDNDMKTPMHMSMGNEHIAVGLCAALAERAQLFCSYRTHALYLALTENCNNFFAELYGKQVAHSAGKVGSMHLNAPEQGLLCASAIVGSCLAPAVGSAFAHKLRGTGKTVAVVFGDGAIDEGSFWESFNLACHMKLPLLFICEDNGLAVHTAKEQRQGFDNISKITQQFNCLSATSSSTDVDVIEQTITELEGACQQQSCPAFLQLNYHRYLEHVGVSEDYDQGYRDKAEYVKWLAIDPIKIQREKLLKQGIDEAKLVSIEEKATEQVTRGLAFAKAAGFPTEASLLQGVFCD